MNIPERLENKRLYFDGGYGTSLQALGIKPGELPEEWNISHSDIIKSLHKEYLNAGCDILKTNTFGANSLKFSDKELYEIIKSAVENAKNAIKETNLCDKFIALDVGPTGKLLKPLGDLEFEDAVDIFKNTIKTGIECGVDLILIETMNDSYETKAAVLAARELCDLPVFVTCAYDEEKKLMTGADPFAMVTMLEGLGVSAIGINCSFGPDKTIGVVEELIKYSSTPIIANPNAGLPVVVDGKTQFTVSPKEFAQSMREIVKKGANIVGGCCGTTPEHIREMIEAVEDIEYVKIKPKNITSVSSFTHAVEFGEKPVLIGERINPTGKKMFKEALKNGEFDYIIKEGLGQEEKNADILDVNVGLPEIDENKTLSYVIKLLQSVTDLPLQIDTSDFLAMENALRIYNGKALINSVNGKKEVMDKIFPLAKKYGGPIIALTLDEDGIPDTKEGRMKISEKIIEEAKKYGIDKKDLIFDPLAMTISADEKSALVTLECIEEFKKRGIKTSLGVSNVSFGLPERSIINSTFFSMALTKGLNAAIMNPYSQEMMNVYYGFLALSGMDEMCRGYIEYATKNEKKDIKEKEDNKPLEEKLSYAILKGIKNEAREFTNELLKENEPLSLIDRCIIPSLNEIGEKFEKKQAFLPQLLMSAEAAKEAFGAIKNKILKTGEKREKKYKIVIATVKGDIHDIGKNIVKVLLENYDFDVVDLGKDVPTELILEQVKKDRVKLVGLSALMTTTVPAMEETIKMLRKEAPWCKVMVGGAVLTKEYAKMIDADKYAHDAMEAVRYAQSLI